MSIISLPPSGSSLGGKKHTRSTTVPLIKAAGDTWDELDSNNKIIFTWLWDGSYWISLNSWNWSGSFINQSSSNTIYFTESFIVNAANLYQIYFDSFAVGYSPLGTLNNTNDWTVELFGTRDNTTKAILSTVSLATERSSINVAQNTWGSLFKTINGVDIPRNGSSIYGVSLTKQNNPGNISIAFDVKYRLGRL